MFHAFTVSQLLDFKSNVVKDTSFTDVSHLRLCEGCGMYPLKSVLYDLCIWMYDFTLLRETCPGVKGRYVSRYIFENQEDERL